MATALSRPHLFLAWTINDLLRLRRAPCSIDELAGVLSLNRQLQPLGKPDLLRRHLRILVKAKRVHMKAGRIHPPASRKAVAWRPEATQPITRPGASTADPPVSRNPP